MKTFLQKHQGWLALAIAVAVFWITARLLSHFAPDDQGINKEFVLAPGGFLHQLLLGVVIFFMGTALAWFAVQIDWKAFDRQIDKGLVETELTRIANPELRLRHLFAPYFLHLLWFCAAQWLASQMLR